MSSSSPTVFTRIIDGTIPGRFVWADETCVAFATIEPHTDGHVLVVPRQEVGSYVDASDELVAHLAVVARRIGATQTRVFDAERAGVMVVGYGVDHLHVHVLPRWHADTNFMTAVAETRVIPEHLEETLTRVRSVWDG